MVIKHVTTKGRNFARAGLDMGRFALESGAKRLLATAERLGTWSTKLAPAENKNKAGACEHDEASAAQSAAPDMSAETAEPMTGHEETIDMA